MRSAIRCVAATTVLLAASAIAAPAAHACTPHVESQGPPLRVQTFPEPDVAYDGTGTFVRVVTCLG